MRTNQCPAPNELSDYLLGSVDDDIAEAVDAHVASCVICQSALETCQIAGDALISTFKAGHQPSSFDDEPELKKALESIGNLHGALKATRRDESSDETAGLDVTEFEGPLLGQYRLLKLLGKGGMGGVYQAEHARLEMIVAIKILADHLTIDEQAIARFDREMKAVGKLGHPNIVRATDAGEDSGRHYLAMEFIDGQDVGQILRSHRHLRINDACEVVRQAATGIQHAHELGLIHRDLKPSNLMVTREGQVKVLDLGLARLRTADRAAELTDDFQVMGTADYMAPEQVLKAKEVDERTDIYSLGCTLYALLCGRPPFADKQHDSSLRKLMAHEQEQAVAVSTRRRETPPELSAIIDRALAKSPVDRFSSAAEFAAALLPFAADANLKLLVDVVSDSAQSLDDTSDASRHLARAHTAASLEHQKQTPRRATSRKRTLLAFALLAAVAVAAIVLQFKTPEGTIVVEIEGDLIGTEFEGERLLITDRNSKTSYYLAISGGKSQQLLKAGSYRIQVENEASGLRLQTHEFQITRKNQTIVKAYVQQPAMARATTIDRRVATRVLELGGDVELISGQQHFNATKAADIPDGDFSLYRIRFLRHAELTDQDFTQFAELTELVDLNFGDIELTDRVIKSVARIWPLQILQLNCRSVAAQGFESLNDLPHLRYLTLEGPAINDEVATMVSDLTNVIAFTGKHTQLSDECLSHLAKMQQLQLLSIVYSPISTPDLSLLASLPNLSELHLAYTQLGDDGLKDLSQLSQVRWLNVGGTRISDRGLLSIGQTTGLQHLTLDETAVSSAGLANLLSVQRLHTLEIVDTRVDVAAVDILADMKALTELQVGSQFSAEDIHTLRSRLPNCQITGVGANEASHSASRSQNREMSLARWAISKGAIVDLVIENRLQLASAIDDLPHSDFQVAGINFAKSFYLTDEDFVQLVNAPSLNHLEFQDLELTDRVIAHLAAVPQLAILSLRYDETQPRGLELLRQLPHLFDLTVGGSFVGDGELAVIRTLDNVRRLTASGRQVTDAGLVHLGEMKQLEFVSLIFSQVDGRGLVHLQKLPKLWGLHLPYTPTNDVGLQNITGLSEITWLNLGFTNVSDECLSQVSKLKKLDTLELNDADVTGAGLSLLSDIASLRTLDLQGTEITDADIEHLGGMTQLTTLRVGSRLSPNTVATLRGRLPNCTIDTTP